MSLCWTEAVLTPEQFEAALCDGSLWEACDGGMAAALRDASDFLALAQQSCPTVVLLKEGYHEQQSAALDKQLPPELRTLEGRKSLPAPPELMWHPSANMLHPLQLLGRELTGHAAVCLTTRQPVKVPACHLGAVPFAVMERCKLLHVQYVLKELHQQHLLQDTQQAAGAGAQHVPQQPGAAGQQQQPEHQHVWGGSVNVARVQAQPLCRRLSMRVLLQRLPAAPLPDEAVQDGVADSSWQQRGLQGCGQTQQVAYMCSLEYPAFTLESSDYLVPAQLFEQGLSSWQALQKGEAFSMQWDGTSCRGFARGYRQRRAGDAFQGSPWLSVAVEWEGHSTNPNDPADWNYGNPWEMTRESAVAPQLPDAESALAAVHKAGHPVLAAPWTTVWAAATAEAAARATAKRKRQGQHHQDDDFVYEDTPIDEVAMDATDLWDPTAADFYYDDDPEDFELDLDEQVLPRRKSSRRQQQHSSARSRYGSRQGAPLHGLEGDGGCCGSRVARGAAPAAPGELTHTYGRELLARSDVCLVCGSGEGVLVSGHTGRTGSGCSRQYHAGCLLLLNAVGIRSITLARAATQRRGAQAGGCSSSSGGRGAPSAGDKLCDGLLGVLWQQSQQRGQQQLSGAVVAAVAAARAAAGRVASGELSLVCPSHICHGCGLNGKLEFMVWCCCCWVRVYHHRQCVPYGAEHVKVDGRDFIRCPHCKAAGVAVPGSAAAPALQAVSAAAGGEAAAAAGAATAAAAAAAAAAEQQQAAGTAAGQEPAADRATSSSQHAAADEAVAMQVDQAGIVTHGTPDQQPQPQQQQEEMQQTQQQQQQQHHRQQSSDTLEGLSDCAVGAGSADNSAAAAGQSAQAAGADAECVDLLDSSEPGEYEQVHVREVIVIDSSDSETDHQEGPAAPHPPSAQQQQPAEEANPSRQQQEQAARPPPAQQQQQQPGCAASPPRQQRRQPQQQQASTPQQQQTGHACAAPGPSPGTLAMVADLDAQLQALVQQQEQQQQRCLSAHLSDGDAEHGTAEQQVGGAAAGHAVPAAAAAAAAAVAADERQVEGPVQGPTIPPWLQLALDDPERVSPSYVLVPCAASGAAATTSSDSTDAALASTLAAAAAAGVTLPPTATAAGGVDGEGVAGGGLQGLVLSSPHSHWLVGCLSKAEAYYRPANMWGCAMIGVPQCPDESVYGLAVVLDFLPALQQQQQLGAAGECAGAAATARVRPGVYLRCSKAVAQDGRLQPALHAQEEGERRQGRKWQVLVNGLPYEMRQGRKGQLLSLGDVITVQGLSFKLQLAL